MTSVEDMKSFKNKEDAEKLLKDSRKRIDEIDKELFDLISQRTSLAKDIALSRNILECPFMIKVEKTWFMKGLRGYLKRKVLILI